MGGWERGRRGRKEKSKKFEIHSLPFLLINNTCTHNNNTNNITTTTTTTTTTQPPTTTPTPTTPTTPTPITDHVSKYDKLSSVGVNDLAEQITLISHTLYSYIPSDELLHRNYHQASTSRFLWTYKKWIQRVFFFFFVNFIFIF